MKLLFLCYFDSEMGSKMSADSPKMSEELLEVTQGLTSAKKRERLMSLEKLQNLLRRDDILNLLHSKNETSNITWTALFIRIHNAILTDVDNASSKNIALVDKHLQIMQNVILDMAQKSYHGEVPLLDCDTVLCCVLSIFELPARLRCLGSVYTHLITKYILGNRKFWGEIKVDHWIEMKNICKNCFKNPPPNAQSVIYLDALSDIIRLSCKNALISQNLLDVFCFVNSVLTSHTVSFGTFGVSLLRLINILCLHLAVEFRYKVCSFMEDIFECVVNLHDKKKNNKNPLIYDFLITYLNVHNPNGVSDTDESFYAFDECKWKQHIARIFSLTQDTTKLILRDPENSAIEVGFLDLLVEINFLVFMHGFDRLLHINSNSDNDDYLDSRLSSCKRKRSVDSQASPLSGRMYSSRNKQIKRDSNFFYVMQDLQSPDAWFWLLFLELLLQKYPQILAMEYKIFTEILSKLLHDYRDPQNTRAICRCLNVILMKGRDYVKQLTGVEEQQIKDIWNDVGVEVVRLLQNEESTDCHLLMRSLIINSKCQNPLPLINLYCKGIFEGSVENFLTLVTLCQSCTLPDSLTELESSDDGQHHKQVRLYFLKWLFRDRIRYPVKELLKLLVTLILTKSEEDNEICVTKNIRTLITSKNINDFCKIITNSYERVALKNLKFIEDVKPNEKSASPKVDSRMLSELFNCLDARFKKLNNELYADDLTFDETVNIIRDSLHHCELVMSFYTTLTNFNIEIEVWTGLLEKLKTLLFLSTKKSYHLLENNYYSLACFVDLYSLHCHADLAKMIREKDCTYLIFLQHLFKTFQEQFKKKSANRKLGKDDLKAECESGIKFKSAFSTLISNPRSILHIDTLKEEEKKIMEIVEVLCHFIIIPGCSERNKFQKTLEIKLFEELEDYDYQNFNSKFHLQTVFSVAYNYTKSVGLDSDILNKILKLLLLIFESKKFDCEVVMVILQIMKECIPLIHQSGNSRCESNFIALISGFTNMVLQKKKYGCGTIIKFIEFLSRMVNVDWKESSIFKRNDKYDIHRFCREIILFLKHPYYEVRLFAAQHIGTLFRSVEKNCEVVIDWQKTMMNLLKKTLKDVDEDIKENEVPLLVLPYYKVMGMSVSLIAWVSIICLSSYWRRSALFDLLLQAYVRKFDPDKIRRAIGLVCRELNINDEERFISPHLPFLIKKWAEEDCELEEFPFYILRCQTNKEFLGSYLNILLPILLWNGFFTLGNKISDILNKSVKQLLQECFPELMAIILPSISENVETEIIRNANKLKHVIDKELGVDSFELIPRHMDKIIFRMFYYIEDKNYLCELCHIQGKLFEDCQSVRFSVAQINEALENICQSENRSLLGQIALEKPFVIQKVLILLASEIERAYVCDDKIISLYKYVAFVEVLSKTTREIIFRSIVTFVVRDVIYTIIAFIRSSKSHKITNMALKCIKRLLQHYILEFNDVLSEFLSVITILCKPLVIEGNKEALDILKFLICDNCVKLQSAITALDSFPTEIVFEEINNVIKKNKGQWTSAQDTIRHFLEVADKKRCCVEGLKYLRDVLTNKKEELKIMYDDLTKLRGFSEDCSKSLLHQLMCSLIELTADKNPLVRAEAAKCLAELGPLDLTTLVLKPENLYAKEKVYKSPQHRLLKSCLNDLSDLIINENLEIKSAASDLLYIILATDDGNEVIKEVDSKTRAYIMPYFSTAGKSLTLKNNALQLQNNIDQSSLWNPVKHEEWITSLVTQLLKSFTDTCGLIEAMVKMVQVDWHFAEKVFPIILDLIFSLRDPAQTEVINRNVGRFFEEYFDSTKKPRLSLNLKSLQCMVHVVDYLRIQRNYEGIYDKSDLNVNYLHVAEAARCCSAFFTSILYVELWFDGKKKSEDNLTIDKICELYPEEGFTLTKILRECYSKIGIFDGVHGCGYMHLLDFAVGDQQYDQLKNRNLSMLYHDIEISQGFKHSERPLINSLQQFGMFYTVNNLIQSSKNKNELSDIQYECASNLCDWTLLDNPYPWQNNSLYDTFEKNRYFALKAFHDDDQQSFQNEIHKARRCTINKLSSCSLESVQNLYQFLAELRCLQELEDFAIAISSSNVNELEALYRRWRQHDSIKCSDFKLVERILAQRITMIKVERLRNANVEVKNLLHFMACETYYKLIKFGRKEKRHETAVRNLSYLSRVDNVPDGILGKIKLEKSLLEWELGDTDIGKFLLCHYLKRNEIKGELTSKALRIYGDWMASTNSENSRYIIDNYYYKSIEISKNGKDTVNAYASVAKFADSNYEQVNEYLSSPLFEIKKNITNRQQDIALELRQEMGGNEDRDKKIAYRLVERQSVIDENEIQNNVNEKNLFLSLAVKYYLLTLKDGEKYDLLVFRLISLWFSNLTHKTVTTQIRQHLNEIPTYKFLCLLPQIVPRMVEEKLISNFVEQCLKDHPHHALPVLFALANSFQDAKYGGAKPTSYTQRALVARSMLEKFQKNEKLKDYITEMDLFCDAMIELANTSPGERKSVKSGIIVKIPGNLKFSRLKNLQFVAVPSLTISYRKSCKYDNVIGIRCFEDYYQLVGGINVPKKIKCIGLDGITRCLIVKGRDDLRQDAVMQQVFTIMNSLLYRNSETNRRKLIIRTYKVVPLSHRSGIIEWCENTQPLSLYLIGADGKSGAHKKFNPQDITAMECRTKLRQTSGIANVTNDLKLSVFLDICERFRPAFRHFFFEHFPEPGVWFERRLAYTQSVATSSMIGYVLGIGDRHVHNILIDNATAEVIHIDLGIAFEQGKTLPTPETVPFRLTRDIVDGMGISGVEGVFRLSCIKTMEVLRENHHTILTLLEVLLYDPLYAWALTAEKAFLLQGHAETDSSSENNSSEVEINKMAERALIRLKQKLYGIETGGVATNAEGQVNYLIQQARDPNNLCRLFHGWQPYL